MQDVEQFIGDRDRGAFQVLCEAYHQRLRDIWPQDVEEAFDAGTLDAGFAPQFNRTHPGIAVSVAPAGNVLIPAILALETQGFTVTCDRSGDSETWNAVRGNTNVSAPDPVQLLGLASMVSTRGASWQASDAEIASVMNRFGLT